MLRKLRKILGNIVFADISPIIRLGTRKVLDAKDMPSLPEKISPRNVAEGMQSLPLDGPPDPEVSPGTVS